MVTEGGPAPQNNPAIVNPEIRFLAWVLGIVALVAGLTMLLLPFLFESILYDTLRQRLVPAGLLALATGLLLLIWQFLSLENTRVPRISLLAGGAVGIAWSVASVVTHTSTASAIAFVFGATAVLAGLGLVTKLPRRIAANLFCSALAVSLAAMSVMLLSQWDVASPMYQFVRSQSVIWGLALFAGAVLLALWVLHPGDGLWRALPAIAGIDLLLWNYEYAFRNVAVLGMLASIVGAAAIARPFIPNRLLEAPPSRIVNRLVAISTILVGVALVLLVVLMVAQSERAYQQRAQRDLLATAQLTGGDTAALVQNQYRFAQLMSRDPDVQSFEPQRQIAALQRATASDPLAGLISIANADGVAVARSTGEQPGIDREQQIAGMARLYQTHQGNWDLIQSPTLGVPVLVVRTPIFGPDGQFEGALAVQVPLKTFTGQLQNLLASLGGRIIIVDQQGRVIAHPDPTLVANRADLSSSPPIAAVRAGQTGPLVYRDSGVRWAAAPAYVKELGWTVVAERPELLVLLPSIQGRIQATFMLLLVLAVAAAAAYLFANSLIDPIRQLVPAAKALGEGEMETELPVGGDDEIGQLVHAFADMRRRLVQRTDERERAVEAAAALVRGLRRSEERFRHQALTDALTGLSNRTQFMELLVHDVERAKDEGRTLAVFFVDVDGFKNVNDSLGHALGDEILIAVAKRLEDSCGEGEALARFGGDEFAILVHDAKSPDNALANASRLLDQLRQPIQSGSRELVLTASLGVAIGGAAQPDAVPDDLLRQADIALYQAKAEGKARAILFSPRMSAMAVERWALQNDLSRALERTELRVYYQPIFDLQSGSLVATEALVRWQHPQRGLLEPEAFVPLAEETGLILEIGTWVLRQACMEAQAMPANADGVRPAMSVNLSARQLHESDLVDEVAAALHDTGLEANRLDLELTESVILRDREAAIPRMQALKSLGVSLTIDDFGTGYSSLSYLQRLPVDSLKVDRSFVMVIDRDPGSLGIVQVIIDLAHARGLTVTAEGVESLDQLTQLRALGCDRGQGFYLAVPAPPRVQLPTMPAEKL
jgi:diguanylate cyclase (GGDEF)-like protein